MKEPEPSVGNQIIKLLMYLIPTIIILAIIADSFVIVPAGFKGVKLHFGAVVGVLDEGIHFVIPFVQEVIKMETRTRKYQSDADSASKDLQSVTTTIALNYRLDAGQVGKIYSILGTIESTENRIIIPAIEEGVKASTAQFTAEELITKRPEVKTQISETLKERLKDYGIIVETVSIVNFQFSEQFDKAIESKVTAEQEALTAQRVLERVKFEAQQKIESAKGESEAKVKLAEAEAKAIELQGKALRENPEVVNLRWIEKWNGIMPVYFIQGGTETGQFFLIPTEQSIQR